MTVTSTKNLINHESDGLTDTFGYDFLIQSLDQAFVYENEVLTLKEYNMTGLGDSEGGTVVFTPTLPDVGIVSILRNVPVTQLLAYTAYGPFPSLSHEGALDKLTLICQQLQNEFDSNVLHYSLISVDQPTTIPDAPAVGTPQDRITLAYDLDGWVHGPTVGQIEDASDNADAAAASAASAALSALAALDSENKASEWAENPEDVEVEPGEFSALHWAAKAEEAAEGIGDLDSLSDVNDAGILDGQTIIFDQGSGFYLPGDIGDFKADGSLPATGDFNLGGNSLLNVDEINTVPVADMILGQAKVLLNYDGVGDSIRGSLNISSVVVGGAGTYVYNYVNDFALNDYTFHFSGNSDLGSLLIYGGDSSGLPTVGSNRVNSINTTNSPFHSLFMTYSAMGNLAS